MVDRPIGDPAEQPRCTRCDSGGILYPYHLYTPDGSARHVWLCDLCGHHFSMSTPWPGMITAADYDRAAKRPRRRGPKPRQEKMSIDQFAELVNVVRRAYFQMHQRAPDNDELSAILAPIMKWESGDRRTLERWLRQA